VPIVGYCFCVAVLDITLDSAKNVLLPLEHKLLIMSESIEMLKMVYNSYHLAER
jgi:hypothetical protein